jgi:thioredoxin reductase
MEIGMNENLPVVVIGAGPVGLAAAAHLLSRGLEPLVLESGNTVGAGMLRWAHVRMFSPWEFNVDQASAALLSRHGWMPPPAGSFPTGGDIVERYLRPLSATPEIALRLRVDSRVVGVTRQGRDRMKNAGREARPFLVRYREGAAGAEGGEEREVLARAVIDASGTVDSPNPLGASGLPALGERGLERQIFYGMPDVLGPLRARYAGRRVLVVGSGHSAFNVLLDLATLARDEPATRIVWALRRPSLQRVLGGGESDQLAERGRLGMRIRELVEAGALEIFTGFHVERLARTSAGIIAHGGERALPSVDEIVASTGFRPDLSFLSEVRLDLDPGTESPRALAPLIDPNLHSCGSVRPHGAEELKHPEGGLYVVGMKSYGRAPTFLLLTGYEQVRSVVAAIDGDWDAARRVELILPETGVCITQLADELPALLACCDGPSPRIASSAGCCGGPAPEPASACCVRDAEAKGAGQVGCGCSAA